jgi:PAS domain S-box-containing protein
VESIARPKRRRPTIHSHLIRLVLACVIPVWLIAGFLVYHAYSSKRAVIKEHMLETARALTMSVDRELAIAQAALQTLSTSPVFDSGDSAGMHNQVLELLNFYPQADIIVADASGQQLVNSYKPFGTPLPKRNIPETVRRIFQYGKPIVSDLYFGAVTKRPLIAIDVPVFVNGQVAYDLSMTLPFNRLASILSQQRLPPEWFGTILDSKGVVVTRTRDPKLYVGKMVASDTRRAIAGSAEGIVEVTSLEGIRVFDAFSRSKTSNWTVVIGIPTSVAMKSMYSWLGWAIGCATILSLAGIALAMRIGNSIAHSIQSLVFPATAMGSGITIAALPPHSVRETECVAEALLQTSRLLEKRAAERNLAEAALKDLNETLENRVVERTAALSASESTLRAILTQMPSGVTVRDARTGTIILSNSRSLEILGDLVEVPDQFPRYRGFHPDGSPIRTEEWPLSRSMTNGEIVKQEEVECEQVNGTRITLSISSVPIRDRNGEITMGVAIFDDITKRKRAEEALKKAHDDLAKLVEQRTSELREKEVMLKEIHHRVKNNLQVISSLVGLQADGSSDETVREVLRDVTYRVRSMALVHEKLYQSNDLAHIDFAEYTRGLLSYLWRAHGAVAATVRLTLDLKPVSLPVDTAVPCGLILNELAGNALKHAFHGRSDGEVIVSLQNSADGRIHLSVADNGVGLPAEFDWREASSLGLRLVQMLSGQLDASVEASGEEGTRFEIVFSGL